MSKEQMKKCLELMESYSTALSNTLYKHYSKEELEKEEKAIHECISFLESYLEIESKHLTDGEYRIWTKSTRVEYWKFMLLDRAYTYGKHTTVYYNGHQLWTTVNHPSLTKED